MSDIAKKIDEIIKQGLVPLLKKEGFKKKSRNFYREHNNRVEIINIQASQFNEGNNGKFTINVGVYYPDIAKITEAPSVKGIPKEYNCTIRERIGSLTPENKDQWWEINGSKNDFDISMIITQQVEELCLPWLQNMSNLEAVKTAAASKNLAFIAAGIALFQSNREDALTYLEQAFKQQPLAKSKMSAWGKKHGLVQA